jgi:arylsulfatase A-like enzyme
MAKKPNILMIVSDEERRNGWLSGKADLPAHDRLAADGLTFNRYYTHSSPCSPSRASLYTGSYLAQHGVIDNVSFPAHTSLDPSIPTIGSLLNNEGYHSSYLGKWHLSHEHIPVMTDYGYQDFRGNDMHYTGRPGVAASSTP